ncbi:MAG: hypothetical protein Q7J78_04390, partial [Clostridiales bacterium]|nr:hypothetical protein [Clostridiales bacterium]
MSKDIINEFRNTLAEAIKEQRGRSVDHERSIEPQLHREGWDNAPRDSDFKRQDSGREVPREIRADGIEVSQGHPPEPVQLSSLGGRAAPDDAQGGRRSTHQAGDYNGANVKDRPDTEPRGHDGFVQTQGNVKDDSRRNHHPRTDIHTKITEENIESQEPKTNGSFFSPEEPHEKRYLGKLEVMDEVLKSGSNIIGGKQRIYDFLLTDPDIAAFARMLKNEYGIGGVAHPVDFGVHRIDYNGKGITVEWIDDAGTYTQFVTWNAAAKRIRIMAEEGRYIDGLVLVRHGQQSLFNLNEMFSTEKTDMPVEDYLDNYGIHDEDMDDGMFPEMPTPGDIPREVYEYFIEMGEQETGEATEYERLNIGTEAETAEFANRKEAENTGANIGENTGENTGDDAGENAGDDTRENGRANIGDDAGKNAGNNPIPTPANNLINYRYSPEDEIGIGGQRTKFRANIEAIKTLKVIEGENHLATADEQRILVRYTGWGGLVQAFDSNNEAWRKEHDE